MKAIALACSAGVLSAPLNQVLFKRIDKIGRIVAQIVYYFTAAVSLGAPHRKVSFVVPTGNFGDIFAGYCAQRMGLPIETLVIATNSNDILARTLPRLEQEEALEMLKAESGRAFDPAVVDAFLANAEAINALRCRITQECPSFDSLIDSP